MRRHPHRDVRPGATVSVVIPCYNYGRFLPAAVAAALDQPGLDVEVIVVDDASTDGSTAVGRRLAAADPRVRLVEHATNARHIATFNDGLARATGDFVTLVSADDLIAPGALARAVALMQHHPRVGMVYGRTPAFEHEPPTPQTGVRDWTVWPGQDWGARLLRTGRNVLRSPEAVLRAEVVAALPYRAEFPHTSDLDMWLRVAADWDIGRVNGADQAYYRVHGENMSLTAFEGLVTDMTQRLRTFDAFLDEHPHLDAAGARRAALHRASALEAVRTAHVGTAGEPLARRAAASALLDFARAADPTVVTVPAWRRAAAGRAPSRAATLAHAARWWVRSRNVREVGV